MNIIDVFRKKLAALVNDGEQEVSETLIELATFFYRIDRRVSFEEQKYIDDLLKSVAWDSSLSVEAYQRDCISKVNSVLGNSENDVLSYLSGVMQKLSDLGAADKAKSLAREITDADGEMADDEVRYLDLVMAY